MFAGSLGQNLSCLTPAAQLAELDAAAAAVGLTPWCDGSAGTAPS